MWQVGLCLPPFALAHLGLIAHLIYLHLLWHSLPPSIMKRGRLLVCCRREIQAVMWEVGLRHTEASTLCLTVMMSRAESTTGAHCLTAGSGWSSACGLQYAVQSNSHSAPLVSSFDSEMSEEKTLLKHQQEQLDRLSQAMASLQVSHFHLGLPAAGP